MDLEAVANDDHSTDSERRDLDGASSSYFFKYTKLKLHLILDDFIDDDHDETQAPIASSASWNALRNDGDLDEFFAGIYERMRPTVGDTTDPHNCIRTLPGLTNFPYGVLDVGYVYVLLENLMKNI